MLESQTLFKPLLQLLNPKHCLNHYYNLNTPSLDCLAGFTINEG
jgi:hypothetical protein